MNLPSGSQFGLYSDQADSVVPQLTKDIIYPEQLDSLGNVISPEVKYKRLISGLIPIAIAAIQDLDSIVTRHDTSKIFQNGLTSLSP